MDIKNEDADNERLDVRVTARLREQLDGKRALLVTNRREIAIEAHLLEHFGLEVTWIDCSQSRKLQAARQTVSKGGCDFVLVVTSFVGHNVDHVLKPACKQHGVPFVSVYKGRISAILSALARSQFGAVEGGEEAW